MLLRAVFAVSVQSLVIDLVLIAAILEPSGLNGAEHSIGSRRASGRLESVYLEAGLSQASVFARLRGDYVSRLNDRGGLSAMTPGVEDATVAGGAMRKVASIGSSSWLQLLPGERQ